VSNNDALKSYFLLSVLRIRRPERKDLWKSSWNMIGTYIIIMSNNDALQSYFSLNPLSIRRPERTDLWKSSWNMTGNSEKKNVTRPKKSR
jgi:hypothetical protein